MLWEIILDFQWTFSNLIRFDFVQSMILTDYGIISGGLTIFDGILLLEIISALELEAYGNEL